MTEIKTNLYLIIFLSICFIQCSHRGNAYKDNSNTALAKYELVQDWPRLPKGFNLSDVTAVGIDRDQNIFYFNGQADIGHNHFQILQFLRIQSSCWIM